MSKTQGDHVGETNKMITAVEWIIEQLQAPCRGIPSHIIDKAKEMEKEQHIKTWGNGWVNGDVNIEIYESVAEQFYNETFNK
jgi:hypothetical protein